MKSLIKSVLALSASSLLLSSSAQAAIIINIEAGRLDLADGSAALAEGALIQLVNLGADGIFNDIVLDDGNTVGDARWVSGDDTLVTAVFTGGVDFSTGKAFDFLAGSDAGAGGVLFRNFEFADSALTLNGKLGIRWFAGLTAANFESTTLVGGERYGQFTDQSAASGATVPWIIDDNVDATYFFHKLGTTEIGGSDPAVAGDATKIVVVPEPAAIGMSLLGAAGLTLLRRRRA